MMSGDINWQALPIVAEILGIIDIEELLINLIAIRDHQQQG
jgi:hypothetical protein